jgi:hypothetical protein
MQQVPGGNKMESTKPFSADFHAALLHFTEETVNYCGSILEAEAQDYAMNYSRMLRNRAKGLRGERVSVPTHFPNADRKVIEGELEKTYRKWFAG